MAISDKNRARFEEIGRDLIQQDLAAKRFTHIGRREQDRIEAQEWVELQDIARRRQVVAIRSLRFVGLIVGAIAIMASIFSFFQ